MVNIASIIGLVAIAAAAVIVYRSISNFDFGSLNPFSSNIELPTITNPFENLEVPTITNPLANLEIPTMRSLELPKILENVNIMGPVGGLVEAIQTQLNNLQNFITIPTDSIGNEAEQFNNQIEFNERQVIDTAAEILLPELDVVSAIEGSFRAFGNDPSQSAVIREIPLSERTLSSIIDEFQVSANTARNIRDNVNSSIFGSFDFGGNTGLGLGPDLEARRQTIIPQNNSNVEFSGLSPEEIFIRLTGGGVN